MYITYIIMLKHVFESGSRDQTDYGVTLNPMKLGPLGWYIRFYWWYILAHRP